MDFEAFLRWTDDRPDGERHELVTGEPVMMAAEKNRHVLVKSDARDALRRAVRAAGAGCTVFGDGVTLRIDERNGYIPDVTVQCGGRIDPDATTVDEPIIVVEVLSPSTRGADSGAKLLGYFQLPSVQHYLMVDPVRYAVVHHRRDGAGIITALVHEGLILLDPPGLELALDDLFESLRAHDAHRDA